MATNVAKTVRVIRDPQDASKDQWIPEASAIDLYGRGQLAIDETNSKPGHTVYCVANEAEKHPQWAAWLAWYTAKYTAHVPLRMGSPASVSALLSWNTWRASWEATRPKWRSFATEKPTELADILWRTPVKATGSADVLHGAKYEVGTGWYHPVDSLEWEGEWMLTSELQ